MLVRLFPMYPPIKLMNGSLAVPWEDLERTIAIAGRNSRC